MIKVIAWGCLSLVIGLAIALLFSPKIAVTLRWPVLFVFLAVFMDAVLVLASPVTLIEYRDQIWLHDFASRRGFKPVDPAFANYPKGCACLLILGTVIVPIIVGLFFLLVFVTGR